LKLNGPGNGGDRHGLQNVVGLNAVPEDDIRDQRASEYRARGKQ
jgi:hypothetical protein